MTSAPVPPTIKGRVLLPISQITTPSLRHRGLCDECSAEMVWRTCSGKQSHWSHLPGHPVCVSAMREAVSTDLDTHTRAIDGLVEWIRRGRLVRFFHQCPRCGHEISVFAPLPYKPSHIYPDNLTIKEDTKRIRPDITITNQDNRPIFAIEVWCHHRTENDIVRSLLQWVEVRAVEVLYNLTRKNLKDILTLQNYHATECGRSACGIPQDTLGMPPSKPVATLQQLSVETQLLGLYVQARILDNQSLADEILHKLKQARHLGISA